MPTDHRAALAAIRDFDQLIAYLRAEMAWPVEGTDFDDLTFEYTPEELGIDARIAAKIQEIKRLRPLVPNQPWGIFFIEFEPKRLPVVALRRILGRVVIKKRASANSSERQAWAAEDLLFVSNYGEGDTRQISFAHFATPDGGRNLPTLKVLGWDSRDTALRLDAVAKELTERLAWPDDESDADGWREQWRAAFTLRHREVITTSRDLSIRLARLAREIRDRIQTALAIETGDGRITKLMKAFQRTLMHDLDADAFADMYAQTIAYGLLSARIADPHRQIADDFAGHMRTNPFLRDLMETFLQVGGRQTQRVRPRNTGGAGIDFDELGVAEVIELLDNANMEAVILNFGDRNPQEDPVIRFYELFLKEYDAEMRMDRGVFYTPRPVVSYIVRSVDELLRTEFGLVDGLADTTTWGEMVQRRKDLTIPEGVSADKGFVQILDPATGTGTFLVEAIDVIHKTLESKWTRRGHRKKEIESLWNDYVPKHLLTRLYGYELLMAPYAIAHLKVSLKLYETGYRFNSSERARAYLTNTLEPARDYSSTFEFAIPALAHEVRAVNKIKTTVPVTVCLGNPPYDRHDAIDPENEPHRSQYGGWVRFGDPLSGNGIKDERGRKRKLRTAETRLEARQQLAILSDFTAPAIAAGHGVQVKNLYNLYVYFWRWALWKVFEHKTAHGPGVVSFISASSYLDGDAFSGMRELLCRQCDEIWVLDLGGEGRGPRKSDNVFAIQTPVAIAVAVRTQEVKKDTPAAVRYARIEGKREEKLATLDAITDFSTVPWQDCPTDWQAPFLSTNQSVYFGWPQLTDLMPWQHSGAQLKRTWPIASDVETLERRWRGLLQAGDRSEAFRETRDRKIHSRHPALLKEGTVETPIAQLPTDAPTPGAERYAYRSFDRQWVIADTRLGDYLRPVLWRARSEQQVYVTSLLTKPLGAGPALTACAIVPDLDHFCNRGAKDTIPLYRTADASQANILPDLLDILGAAYRRAVTPEDFLAYAYGALAQPAFTERFATELETRELRVPITKDAALFDQVRAVGAQLLWLHTYGERFVPNGKQSGQVPSGAALCARAVPGDADGYPDKFTYDEATCTLHVGDGAFAPVAPEVYEFEVSGLKVVRSWLKYRMRKGAGKKSSPLDDLRPERWTSAFTTELLELLWVLEATVAVYPEQERLLEEVVEGDCFQACDLPPVQDNRRKPPQEGVLFDV